MFRYLFYQRKESLRLRYKLHCFSLLNYMQICIAVNILLNVHQIHLAESVRHTEHLYVNNCFIFKYLNGLIIKHIHGTQGVDRYRNHKNNFYAKRLMFNRFLKNSDDLEAIVLYNELTDSVNG